MPPWLVEVGIAVGLALIIFAVRILLFPMIGESVPLAPIFVAIVAAAVLAGWRSALLTLIVGQSLIWVFIMAPRGSIGPKDAVPFNVLIVATLAQLLIIAIIALYQREVDRAWSRREVHLDLLEKALKEIDHRTSNNYQTVLALVLTQAKSSHGDVRDALQEVAGRIRAIADAQRKLAVASISLEQVMVGEHLRDLCASLRRGLTRPGVELHCHFDDMPLGADETVCVSILVNELVTNAIKHAFPDGRSGRIDVALRRSGRSIDLTVEDDGVGIQSSGTSRGTGMGSRLVETFLRQLKAKHEVSSDSSGTRHLIRIPTGRKGSGRALPPVQ